MDMIHVSFPIFRVALISNEHILLAHLGWRVVSFFFFLSKKREEEGGRRVRFFSKRQNDAAAPAAGAHKSQDHTDSINPSHTINQSSHLQLHPFILLPRSRTSVPI